MPSTQRDIRELVGNDLGGFSRGVVSLPPDVIDALAQRQILCGELYDADKGAKGYAGDFAWVGKYRDQRRVRENGYRTLAYTSFIPPTEGEAEEYTLTFYGYGTTEPIPYDATAEEIEAVVVETVSAASITTMSGVNIIALPDIIDTEISAGTIITQGGVGALELNRGFTRALTIGDEFELCSKMPFRDADNVQGLNTLINMALRKMWFIDDVPITPVRDSRGLRTYLNLTNYDWLTSKKQIIAIYNPTYWESISTFTPPDSGSFTLTLDLGTTLYSTDSLLYDSTSTEIYNALENMGANVRFAVTDEKVITLSNTRYAEPVLSTSAGTIVNVVTMSETPSIYRGPWKFQYHGNTPYIDNLIGAEGESFLIKAYIPAHSRVCRQASYGVEGSLWTTTTDGLLDDYDMVVPSADDIAKFAYAKVCDQMVKIDQTDTFWLREAKKAHGVAAGIKVYDLPYEDEPRGNNSGSAGTAWGSKGYW